MLEYCQIRYLLQKILDDFQGEILNGFTNVIIINIVHTMWVLQ